MPASKTYIIIFLIAFTFISCKKQADFDLSGSYTIKSGEKLFLPKNRSGAVLTASDFEDSRCPATAICISEGFGTGKFSFNDDNGMQTVELCIGGCAVASKPKTQDVILNRQTYTIELTDLSPYPGSSRAKKASTATILLKKK